MLMLLTGSATGCVVIPIRLASCGGSVQGEASYQTVACNPCEKRRGLFEQLFGGGIAGMLPGDGWTSDVVVSSGPTFFPVPQSPVLAAIEGSALQPPPGMLLPPRPGETMFEPVIPPDGQLELELPQPPALDMTRLPRRQRPVVEASQSTVAPTGGEEETSLVTLRIIDRGEPLRQTLSAVPAPGN